MFIQITALPLLNPTINQSTFLYFPFIHRVVECQFVHLHSNCPTQQKWVFIYANSSNIFPSFFHTISPSTHLLFMVFAIPFFTVHAFLISYYAQTDWIFSSVFFYILKLKLFWMWSMPLLVLDNHHNYQFQWFAILNNSFMNVAFLFKGLKPHFDSILKINYFADWESGIIWIRKCIFVHSICTNYCLV